MDSLFLKFILVDSHFGTSLNSYIDWRSLTKVHSFFYNDIETQNCLQNTDKLKIMIIAEDKKTI